MYNFRTRNGKKVIIPFSTIEHMSAHSDVDWGIVDEAVAKINYLGGFLKVNVDMGRVIGVTTCVKVDEQDEVVYLYRKNRQGKTPFVYNKQALPTTVISIIIREASCDKSPVLVSAWYGGLAPMEPWDARRKNVSQEEIEESDRFWSTHALIYDEQSVDLDRK